MESEGSNCLASGEDIRYGEEWFFSGTWIDNNDQPRSADDQANMLITRLKSACTSPSEVLLPRHRVNKLTRMGYWEVFSYPYQNSNWAVPVFDFLDKAARTPDATLHILYTIAEYKDPMSYEDTCEFCNTLKCPFSEANARRNNYQHTGTSYCCKWAEFVSHLRQALYETGTFFPVSKGGEEALNYRPGHAEENVTEEEAIRLSEIRFPAYPSFFFPQTERMNE